MDDDLGGILALVEETAEDVEEDEEDALADVHRIVEDALDAWHRRGKRLMAFARSAKKNKALAAEVSEAPHMTVTCVLITCRMNHEP